MRAWQEPFTIRVLRPQDEALLINTPEGVFDEPIQPALARQFLAEPSHHLIAAVGEDKIVGFASAVSCRHPDKPLELWVNEVGVLAAWRRRGVGRALVTAAKELAAALGARAVWVLAEGDDQRAQKFYSALGGTASGAVMFTFKTDDAG